MTNQRTTRRIHNNDRRSRCSFHRSLRHSCLLPLAAGPSRPPPRPRRPDLEARRRRPSAPGRQRAAGGPAETIWRCGSAHGSAGQGSQRGRPKTRRTWGETVRDKRRLRQVPAAQASAADECRCGGLGGDPPIIPRASHPPPADVHWHGAAGLGAPSGRLHGQHGLHRHGTCGRRREMSASAQCASPGRCDEAERAIVGLGVRGRRRTR